MLPIRHPPNHGDDFTVSLNSSAMSPLSESISECDQDFDGLCSALAAPNAAADALALMPLESLQNQYVRFRLWSASLNKHDAAAWDSPSMSPMMKTVVSSLKELSSQLRESKL